MAFLDTSFVIDLFRERHRREEGPAHAKLASLGETPLHLSLFVCCELEAGVALVKDAQGERKRLWAFYEYVDIVYPDERYAQAYGRTLGQIIRRGDAVSTMDLLIAVTALQFGDVLITRNLRDFQKVPGLQIEAY